MTDTGNLVCPACGDTFSAILEYTGYSHSEHRDLSGYECDNYDCLAEWDSRGQLRQSSKLSQPIEPS